MSRRRESNRPYKAELERTPAWSMWFAERASWSVVVATTLLLPLVISPQSKDAYRLPKELLLESSGILLAALAVYAWIAGVPLGRSSRWPRSLLATLAGVLTWSTISTLISTNRVLSIDSLVMLAASVMLFVAVYNAAQSRSASILYVAIAPAFVNALVAVVQRIRASASATTDTSTVVLESGEVAVAGARAILEERLQTIGLLGNPNDLGMFLVAPTLAAAALAVVSRTHRLPACVSFAALCAGVVASETVGAIAALSFGLFLLLWMVRPRIAVAAALLAILVLTAVLWLHPARRAATQAKVAAVAEGNFDPLLSGRVPGFLAAWQMFRSHHVVGVGPGCFAFHYFDAKLEIQAARPELIRRSENFGEAHNEHLQILAETGLPGYTLFLLSLLLIAMPSIRPSIIPASTEVELGRHLGLPLAAALFVLTLSSFPLRLAAPTANGLFIAAAALAWSHRAAR
jgi:O-antigen ligase